MFSSACFHLIPRPRHRGAGRWIPWLLALLLAASPAFAEAPSTPRRAARPAAPPERDLSREIAERMEEWRPFLPAALGAAAFLLLGGGWLLWRRRHSVQRLPEFPVEPRLGGESGAGTGAILSFADPTQAPSEQRELRPDWSSLP